jgi:hypothetical protein
MTLVTGMTPYSSICGFDVAMQHMKELFSEHAFVYRSGWDLEMS